MEIKLPEGFDNREKAIESLIKKEFDAADSELAVIRDGVAEFLVKNKGYAAGEIERDVEFDVIIGAEKCRSRADFIVKMDGKKLILIKCSVGALVSRERQALASARVMDSYQIPFAIVTDGNDATILNALTGETINEGLEKIPSRDELKKLAGQVEFRELPPNREEKEKRILLAFDSIKCSINYGE